MAIFGEAYACYLRWRRHWCERQPVEALGRRLWLVRSAILVRPGLAVGFFNAQKRHPIGMKLFEKARIKILCTEHSGRRSQSISRNEHLCKWVFDSPL